MEIESQCRWRYGWIEGQVERFTVYRFMLRLITVQTSVALVPSLIIEGPGMYTNRCARTHTHTRGWPHTYIDICIYLYICMCYVLCTLYYVIVYLCARYYVYLCAMYYVYLCDSMYHVLCAWREHYISYRFLHVCFSCAILWSSSPIMLWLSMHPSGHSWADRSSANLEPLCQSRLLRQPRLFHHSGSCNQRHQPPSPRALGVLQDQPKQKQQSVPREAGSTSELRADMGYAILDN